VDAPKSHTRREAGPESGNLVSDWPCQDGKIGTLPKRAFSSHGGFKMKRLSMAVVTAMSIGICGSVIADDVFMIGTKDSGRSEFFDNVEPNGTLLDGCPFDANNPDSGKGTFIYGMNVDGDFPGFFQTPDANSVSQWIPYSCRSVEIKFSIEQACVNGSLNYGRAGAETVDIFLNGELVARTNAVDNVLKSFENPIDGFLLPGEYSVELKAVDDGGADGYAANDYLQLACDPLAVYAKVSGRIDDPAVTKGRGAPLVTLYGQVGKTLSGGIVGSIDVLYKNFNRLLNESCTFTPTASSDIDVSGDGLKVVLRNFYNSCDGTVVDRLAAIYDKSWDGAPYCGNANGRGCFGVDGGTGYKYRIDPTLFGGVGPSNYSVDLDAGNGIVVVY